MDNATVPAFPEEKLWTVVVAQDLKIALVTTNGLKVPPKGLPLPTSPLPQ